MGSNRNKENTPEHPMATRLHCWFGWLMFLSEVLLCGVIGLCIFWVIYYGGGVAWANDTSKQFNLHYVLMTGGFIFLNGQSMLVYRIFFCCKKIYNKVVHTIVFVLAISAITIGMISAIQAHNNSPEPKHFYSLHSWIGLATMGFYALQFIVGFVSFLVLLCCDVSTAKFRQQLLPTHKTFGVIIFSMAVAACVTGLTQSARHRLSGKDGKENYEDLPEQAIVINILGIAIVTLGILLAYLTHNVRTKCYPDEVTNETHLT
ncbi:lysosomal membrane ascorbate-dependent ferrireductase CYB561A3-like isoform X1 [Tachypleus tridentatus]|uniref:lysosomal membrane ascorbate-dependent ferrireductase CYB561A3-like isoform X1 n=1 Tax=Tachypleus tridentatus TaxID=6853 RepID=UPI003FD583AF